MDIVVQKIKEILEDSFNGVSGIKQIYVEDPNFIPKSALPCIAIVPTGTEFNIADNARDINTFSVEIRVIEDITNTLGRPGNEVAGTTELIEKMEARNENGQLKDNTVYKVIRDNLDLGEDKRFKISNVGSISYTAEVRQQRVTKEAVFNVEIDLLVNRK
ncbi:MAG: hypothetical protein ACOCTT_01540 [archaeon]